MEILKLLELAIKAEAAATKRYAEGAKLAEDTETRLMFEELAAEEASHERKLKERLTAIRLLRNQ